ncbi:organic cation transporter protein-like [Mytilus californianus]|uniref:organic cation transporter protein-like n=1 Tax=Mytilus californianus TaxID=6549 RepID=UPI0022466EC2|nr:organic cation transporter protein-like [Mytilus californianus]
MKFDDILKHIGEFGYYQKRLYLLLCLPAISTGCYMMMLVFVMHAPDHRCQIPGLNNDTYQVQNNEHASIINKTIPPSHDEIHRYDRCHYYQYRNNTRDMVKCSKWVYDINTFHETFTSKMNFVCDDAIKTSHAQMIFYGGVLVGDVSFGILSDKIGRKKTFLLSTIITLVMAVGVAFSSSFLVFVILEFMIGAAHHGGFMICCVMSLEYVGPSKRVLTGIPIHIFFAFGIMYIALMGYLLRNWFYVQLAVGAPFAVFLFYWWMIPESSRWLLSQGKYDDAEKIIQRIAKVNKKKIPSRIIDEKTLDTPKTANVYHLFSTLEMTKRTIILLWNWIVIAMVYYGVTMHTGGNIGGNFYLNFFILAIVEVPAKLLVMATLNRAGRKKIHCFCMVVGGVACLCTIFTVLYGGDELQPLTLTLAIIGKMGSAAAFGTIYVYSMELYPTVVRTSGMGLSSSIARIGGMVAPYVAQSADVVGGKFGQALPLVIFGGCSVSAGLLCLFLPETLNRKLPETVREAKDFTKKLDLDDIDKEKTTQKEYLSNTEKEKKKVKDIYTVSS